MNSSENYTQVLLPRKATTQSKIFIFFKAFDFLKAHFIQVNSARYGIFDIAHDIYQKNATL